MTILITGASGFIGSHVALAAADAGHDVAGLVRPKPSHTGPVPALRAHDGITLHEGDLHDHAGLHGLLRRVRPDAILHFGALSPVAYSFTHPIEVHDVNARGTLALAEAARAACPELDLFAFSSSMEVYGNQTDGVPDDPPVYTEDRLPQPAAPYAAAKRAAELHLQVMHESWGFPAVSFRQTNAYGRRHNDYFVVEAFATRMLDATDGGPVDFGDPRPWRNFIHIDDLVALYLTLLDSDTAPLHGEVYNTGPPNAITIRELAARLRELTGYDGDINWYTRELRPGEVWCLNSSHAKLTDALGWAPAVGLDGGLARVVDYWRD